MTDDTCLNNISSKQQTYAIPPYIQQPVRALQRASKYQTYWVLRFLLIS